MGFDIATDANANGGKVTNLGKATVNGNAVRFDEMKTAAPGVAGDFPGYDSAGQVKVAAGAATDDAVNYGQVPGLGAPAIGPYTLAAENGRKTFEWDLYTDAAAGHAMGYSIGAPNQLTNIQPKFMPARTDMNSYMPTGTVVSVAFGLLIQVGTALAASSASPYAMVDGISNNVVMTYFGPTHATKPNNIEITSIRDSDGGTDTDTLTDWVQGTPDYWEFIYTIQANSATGSARIFDLVVKRNGSTVLTKTNRRWTRTDNSTTSSGFQGGNIGAGQAVSLYGNAALKLVYP